MKKLLIKQLIFRIIVLIITCAIVNTVIDFTISAPIENSIAVEQLNGGDTTWLLMQAFYKYKSIAQYIGFAICGFAAIPAIKIIIKLIEEITKEKK